MSRDALVISGLSSMAPLVPLLAEHYDLVLGSPDAANQARGLLGADKGILSLSEFVDPDIQERAANEAALLSARMVTEFSHLETAFGSVYRDMNVPSHLNGDMRTWWPGYIHTRTSEIAMRLFALERLWASRRVAGVVWHEDVTPDARAVIAYGRQAGTPTVHVPHAMTHLLPGVVDIHREVRADYVAASGEAMRDYYLDCGMAEDRIAITGAPGFDGHYKGRMSMPDLAEARRVLRIDNERVILFATTWSQTTSLRSRFEAEYIETLQAVARLANDWGAVVIISMHPHERPERAEYYANVLRTANLPGLVTREHKLYTMRAADLVVTHGPSNMCVDAAIFSRPSCYVQTEGFDFASGLPPRGSANDLGALAEQALATSEDDWTAFVRLYNAAHPDGEASERAAEYVESVCQ